MKNGIAKRKQTKRVKYQRLTQEMVDRITTIGIDLSDRKFRWCGVDRTGEVIAEGGGTLSKVGIEGTLKAFSRDVRVVIEEGCHSHWVERHLDRMGFEVLIADPRKVRLIYRNRKKTDRVDAQYLAKLGQLDQTLLHPIEHRPEEIQRDLAMLRSRDAVISARRNLINHVRGQVKTVGDRIPKCGAEVFHKVASNALPQELQSLEPVLEIIESLTGRIRQFDQQVLTLSSEKYPQTSILREINGVGPLTALATVLVLWDLSRFGKSRDVGAYLGLVPARDDSGEREPQLRITKTGDAFLRRLLVQAAHYILGRFGEDCDLRRFGLRIAARGGKIAKKKAVVAVARKLSVLMHRLLVSGEQYNPFRNSTARQELAA